MNYLITGSSGFLGKSLSKFLENSGHIVFKTHREINNDVLLKFDLLNRDEPIVNNLKSNIDCVVHCAHSKQKLKYQSNLIDNYKGSEKIFKFSKKNNAKLIYISTISCFEGCISNYGRIKMHIEKLSKSYNANILRPGLIYSKQIKENSMFNSLEKIIKKNYFIPVINNGNQIQYMCELETLNKLILQISLSKRTYNTLTVANEKPLFFKDLVKKIARYNSKKIKLLNFPFPIMFYFLKFLEFFKINLKTNSDSLLSLINQKKNVKISNFKDLDIFFPEF